MEPSYPEVLNDENYVPTFLVRWSAGVDWNLRYWSDKTGKTVGPEDVEALTWALAEMGRGYDAGEYLRAVEYHQVVTRKAAEWWAGGFDLLLTPTMALPPLPLGSFTPDPENPLMPIVTATPCAIFTAGFNSTGQPAISLPLHESVEGLPIGIQLVAAYGREDLLLRVAAQLEEASPWAERVPPLFAGAAAD